MRVVYEGLSEYVKDNLNENIDDLYQVANDIYGYEASKKTFCSYVCNMKRRLKSKQKNIDTEEPLQEIPPKLDVDEEMLDFVRTLKKLKSADVVSLADMFDCSPKRILAMIRDCNSKGYEILMSSGKVLFSQDYVPSAEKVKQISETEIVFGVASDLHFGSKAVQLTALNEFCSIAKNNGVKHIFVPGDVLAGNGVYKGQMYDVYGVSSSDQINSTLANLPSGFDWYLMGGNHDYSFIRCGGQNPIVVLSNSREDLHYVGFDEVDVPILNGVDLKMWHPSGGIPYSVSYRLQKGTEQIAFSELQSVVRGVKEKPTVRFVLGGHLHIQMQALFGSIFGMQCGTFEGTTDYLKRKGLVPNVGGYVVKATLGKNGMLKNFEAKFYVFEEVENDWKSYNHSIIEVKEEKKPIFEK